MRDSTPGPRDHDPSRRQRLNTLSHPGAPVPQFILHFEWIFYPRVAFYIGHLENTGVPSYADLSDIKIHSLNTTTDHFRRIFEVLGCPVARGGGCQCSKAFSLLLKSSYLIGDKYCPPDFRYFRDRVCQTLMSEKAWFVRVVKWHEEM